MGNCQAVDAAALVIQHPSGKIERWYWPISVIEVMRMNPGHYVSLIIPLPISFNEVEGSKETGVVAAAAGPPPSSQQKKTVGYTRVKLLQPTDTLVLGRAYRLVTSQEVMKVIRAKKHAKMKSEQGSAEKSHVNHETLTSRQEREARKLEVAETNQVVKNEREQARTMQMDPEAVGRSKSWRPSLHSISEAGS